MQEQLFLETLSRQFISTFYYVYYRLPNTFHYRDAPVIDMLLPVINLLSQKFIIRHKSNGAIHER